MPKAKTTKAVKATKKIAPRKTTLINEPTALKAVKVQKVAVSPVKSTETKSSVPALKLSFTKSVIWKYVIWILVFLVSFCAIDFFIQYLNNDYSIAVVNGQRVKTSEFYSRLKSSFGSKVVSDLVDEQLILQEAKKKKVTVSTKEINSKLSDIETQIGGKDQLDAALTANSLSLEELKLQIRNELLAEKILRPTIKYTDSDLQAFFDQYKSVIYPNETDPKFEDHKTDIVEVYINQTLSTKKTTWLQDLRDKAKIQNNVTQKPKYSLFQIVRNIVNNFFSDVTKDTSDKSKSSSSSSSTK